MPGFLANIAVHTNDGWVKLTDPEIVRMAIGAALDALGTEEEIDYTIEVSRLHGCQNPWHEEKGKQAELLACPECRHQS